MTRYLKISLIPILLSLFVHIYLTLHYYDINFGGNLDNSSCNINSTFNCDTVALSPFAALMGIPISLFGGLTHVVLLILVSSLLLRFSNTPQRTKKHSFWLSGFIALVSIFMFIISITQLSSYCIYCISAYILSFITLFTLWKAKSQGDEEEGKSNLTSRESLKDILANSKGLLIMLLAIPLLAFFFHHRLIEHTLGTQSKKFDIQMKRTMTSWAASPKFTFTSPPSLTKGPPADKATMTVVEFADFLCIHCKHASVSLRTFATAHSDVRFEFYNFPRDGSCNEEVPQKNGINCRIAKAVHCSGKQSNKWTLHDVMFENQKKLQLASTPSDVDNLIKTYTKISKLNWDQLKSCMELAETQDAILSQTKNAKAAKVRGTPSIYVNGQQLVGGHMIPILSNVYKKMK